MTRDARHEVGLDVLRGQFLLRRLSVELASGTLWHDALATAVALASRCEYEAADFVFAPPAEERDRQPVQFIETLRSIFRQDERVSVPEQPPSLGWRERSIAEAIDATDDQAVARIGATELAAAWRDASNAVLQYASWSRLALGEGHWLQPLRMSGDSEHHQGVAEDPFLAGNAFVEALTRIVESEQRFSVQSAEVLSVLEVFAAEGLAPLRNISADVVAAVERKVSDKTNSAAAPPFVPIDRATLESWVSGPLGRAVDRICRGELCSRMELEDLPVNLVQLLGNSEETARRFTLEGLRGQTPKTRDSAFGQGSVAQPVELAPWYRMWCSRSPQKRARWTLMCYVAASGSRRLEQG